jgi:hypothetical protein
MRYYSSDLAAMMAFPRLKEAAEEERKVLDPTFFKELINYGRRIEISELEEEPLRAIVEHFGMKAIAEAESGEKELGAGHVQRAIIRECQDQHWYCTTAGLDFLVEEKMLDPREASELQAEALRGLDLDEPLAEA